MSKRSLAETLVFVNLLFISGLSVRACSGVHDRVRVCFGGVRVMFGYRSGYVRALFGSWGFAVFVYVPKNNTIWWLSVLKWHAFNHKARKKKAQRGHKAWAAPLLL